MEWNEKIKRKEKEEREERARKGRVERAYLWMEYYKKCRYCNVVSDTIENVAEHFNRVHYCQWGNKPFFCPLCNTEYVNFHNHMKRHRPTCLFCLKSGSRSKHHPCQVVIEGDNHQYLVKHLILTLAKENPYTFQLPAVVGTNRIKKKKKKKNKNAKPISARKSEEREGSCLDGICQTLQTLYLR